MDMAFVVAFVVGTACTVAGIGEGTDSENSFQVEVDPHS